MLDATQTARLRQKSPTYLVGLCCNADGIETPAGFAMAPSEPTMASQAALSNRNKLQ